MDPERVETRTQRSPGLRGSSLGIRLSTLSGSEEDEKNQISSLSQTRRSRNLYEDEKEEGSSLTTRRSVATTLLTTA